jgi:hypothetical protein
MHKHLLLSFFNRVHSAIMPKMDVPFFFVKPLKVRIVNQSKKAVC